MAAGGDYAANAGSYFNYAIAEGATLDPKRAGPIFTFSNIKPQQVTDEPLGVESLKFAARADRLVVLAPVLPGVPHDKQRETAAERAKKGPSARNYRRQPVRHWDHWLHQNADRASTHLIASRSDGSQRQDLTPEAATELWIEPEFDLAADGSQVAVQVEPVPGGVAIEMAAPDAATLARLRTLQGVFDAAVQRAALACGARLRA